MEEYMNRDDGAEDWLLSAMDIPEEEEDGVDSEEDRLSMSSPPVISTSVLSRRCEPRFRRVARLQISPKPIMIFVSALYVMMTIACKRTLTLPGSWLGSGEKN